MSIVSLKGKIALGIVAIFVLGAGALGAFKIAKAATTSSCIVTLFGQQYDVSPLQTNHTGGNIFVCGTDMTATYQGMHGTDVTQMIPYLIATATPTPSPSPTVTPNPIPTPGSTITEDDSSEQEDENDDEDEAEQKDDKRKDDHGNRGHHTDNRSEKGRD